MKLTDDCTRTSAHKAEQGQSSSISENSRHDTDILIVFRKEKKVVKVFRPQSNHITFGRSTNCSITLPDPRFPRLCGEIILGPVPLLRGGRHGKKNGEYISIISGKQYRLYPYTLILMEPGDVVINRTNNNKVSRVFLILALLLWPMGTAVNSLISYRQDIKGSGANLQSGNILLQIDPQLGHTGVDDKSILKPKNDQSDNKSSMSINTSSKSKSSTVLIASGNSGLNPLKKESLHTVEKERSVKNKVARISDNELNRSIQTAAYLIGQKDLKMAGRILKPLIQHTNHAQNKRIIESLDPAIDTLFQKAYMLLPYEHEKSQKIFGEIAESGLDFLPSFDKAVMVIKERNATIIDK